jgi:hypothetical protein
VTEVYSMVVDLPACAGCLTAVATARAKRRWMPDRPGVLGVLARGWAEAAVERERRATLALAIAGLPPGWCVIDRDACGRERFIGPAGAASAPCLRGALR